MDPDILLAIRWEIFIKAYKRVINNQLLAILKNLGTNSLCRKTGNKPLLIMISSHKEWTWSSIIDDSLLKGYCLYEIWNMKTFYVTEWNASLMLPCSLSLCLSLSFSLTQASSSYGHANWLEEFCWKFEYFAKTVPCQDSFLKR